MFDIGKNWVIDEIDEENIRVTKFKDNHYETETTLNIDNIDDQERVKRIKEVYENQKLTESDVYALVEELIYDELK